MNRNKNIKNLFKQEYPEATGAYDLYIIFLLKSLTILKEDGVYAWIIPNKFLIADYAKKTKQKLISKGLSYSVDVSTFNVFSNASVYPIILIGSNKYHNGFKEYILDNYEDLQLRKFKEIEKLDAESVFKDFGIKFSSGATGFEAKKLKELVSDKFSNNSLPFTVSGCIDRYLYTNKNVRFMGEKFNEAYISKSNLIADSKWNLWENEKIVIAGMTKVIEAAYVKEPLAIGVGVYAVYDYAGFNPKYLLANLNSIYHSYFLNINFKDKHLAGGYLAINKSTIENLPLVKCEQRIESLFELIIDYILLQNKNDIDSTFFERVIDAMVYEIYLPELINSNNAEVIKYLGDLPKLTEGNDEQNLKLIEKVQKELSNPKHPFSAALLKLLTIDEINIIEGRN